MSEVSISTSNKSKADKFAELANERLNESNFLAATQFYSFALNHEKNVDMLLKRGEAYLKIKNFTEAYNDAIEAENMTTDKVAASFLKARAQSGLGKFFDAETVLIELEESNFDNPFVMLEVENWLLKNRRAALESFDFSGDIASKCCTLKKIDEAVEAAVDLLAKQEELISSPDQETVNDSTAISTSSLIKKKDLARCVMIRMKTDVIDNVVCQERASLVTLDLR